MSVKMSLEFVVAEHQRALVEEQLIRKERLAKELKIEKGRLEAMRKELQALARPQDPSVSPQVCKSIHFTFCTCINV